ncbi:MAG: hypothetical protein Q4A05_05440 [Ruminococcus sp.]|nr:hypothetical protein [Ruminococcus sp.]
MKKTAFMLTVAAVLTLCSCGNVTDEPLPGNATAFESFEFVDPDSKDDGYRAVTYNGRTYIPYGTQGKEFTYSKLGECLGYWVQDGEEMKDVRLYTLTSDPDVNFIAMTDEGFMSQPTFLRAIDTRGKDIPTHDLIDSLDYEYWK